MKCPVDDTVLQMTDRQGIEIDYCPQCRGVWLDRGELDKIIDRSPSSPSASPSEVSYPPREQPTYDERHSQGHVDRRYDPKSTKKRRKESFLGDLFDF
jgi:Zn-finger nucleic acid-binding protein